MPRPTSPYDIITADELDRALDRQRAQQQLEAARQEVEARGATVRLDSSEGRRFREMQNIWPCLSPDQVFWSNVGGGGGAGSTGTVTIGADWKTEETVMANVMPQPQKPEFKDFHEREQWKLANGIFKPVPWAQEPWHTREETAHHHVHIAERDPYMVAYHPSPEKANKGPDGIHVTLKPGRYLQKYYGDKLTPEEIKLWASKVRGSAHDLRFTDDLEDMRQVYRVKALSACMSHNAENYAGTLYSRGNHHPLWVYKEAGLKLAYLWHNVRREYTARALVWPEKQLYTRPYGDTDALTAALANAGYRPGLFDGLRLPAIQVDKEKIWGDRDVSGKWYLCPFVDQIKWAREVTEAGITQLELSAKATGATHSVQHTDAIAYPIKYAPSTWVMSGVANIHADYVRREASGEAIPTDDNPEEAVEEEEGGAR